MADTFKIALAKAERKLEKLLAEREKINVQIVDWKRVVDGLKAVCEDVTDSLPPDVEFTMHAQYVGPGQGCDEGNPNLRASHSRLLKFTDAIREILRLSFPKVIPVPAIRDQLMEWGYDFSKYKQELVPVHNALKRLEEQGEVKPSRNSRGRMRGYQWVAPANDEMGDRELTRLAAKLVLGKFKKIRETTPKVVSQKGQVKTDDAASTKTN